jgi:hypothetical protein
MVYSPVNPWTFPVNPSFPWTPDARVITSITKANPCVITTTAPHGYTTGFNVRVVFPFPYSNSFGMYQINGLSGVITVLSPTSFSMPINTLGFDAFVIGTTLENPQVVPIGQFTNTDLDDFTQVNPPNPATLAQVPIFQSSGLQAAGPCSTSQT